MAEAHGPDVAVIGFAMPVLNGIETTRRIVERLPTTKVIVLSTHSDLDVTPTSVARRRHRLASLERGRITGGRIDRCEERMRGIFVDQRQPQCVGRKGS